MDSVTKGYLSALYHSDSRTVSTFQVKNAAILHISSEYSHVINCPLLKSSPHNTDKTLLILSRNCFFIHKKQGTAGGKKVSAGNTQQVGQHLYSCPSTAVPDLFFSVVFSFSSVLGRLALILSSSNCKTHSGICICSIGITCSTSQRV